MCGRRLGWLTAATGAAQDGPIDTQTLILSLALGDRDEMETENRMRREIQVGICCSPHQYCQCAALLQSKFVFDLRFNIK